jgi:glycosidase
VPVFLFSKDNRLSFCLLKEIMDTNFTIVPWAQSANLYEVNIRQYTVEGTFKAFAKQLPRLKKMGIDILWLMPITPISKKIRQGSLGSYYACSSYTSINPEFGTIDDFKQLVNDAHALGFKLIIDWVANHTGWDHEWTVSHPEWMMKDDAGNFTEKNGWHDVIDLNFDMPDMRKALINAMRFWVRECNIDGFRCDMAHLVPLDFWQQARIDCDLIKPLFWLAECEVVAYHQVFDVSYAWWWMHESDKYMKGQASLNDIRNVLHAYSQYPQKAIKLFFTTNHDENSWNGTEYEKYGITAKAWAVFSFTWKGMPLIYSGQESANTKRLLFFDKDLIEWKEPLALHDFYSTLAHLRKISKAIYEGETFILPSNHDNELMCYLRKNGGDVILVLLNLSKENRLKITVEHAWLSGNFTNVFSRLNFHFNGNEEFELQAGEYFVYEKC